jgi:hypothetical protein
MPLSKDDVSDAADALYHELVDGHETESSIAEIMGWDPELFRRIKKTMLDEKSDEIRTKPREHVYVEYCISQQQNIRDLNDLIKGLDAKQQYNALVGAIRLRSDIYDKIVSKGQEFGLIRKEPERKEVIAGILVSDMSSDDIRQAIVTQLTSIKDLMGKFGDKDLMSLEVGKVHYGRALPRTFDDQPIEVESLPEHGKGSARAKTSRRSAGRAKVLDA